MLAPGTFAGKTVLITGGGTGLGKSMAHMLGQLGANVVIASRKLDVIEAAAKELAELTGAQVLGVACDVRSHLEVDAVLDAAWKRFGRVDILINNAAGNFISPTEKLSPRAFETVVDIVLKGSINCTLACGKRWIEDGKGGNIISITTTYAWTGTAYTVPSATAKAGVLALMQSLAVEWGPKGIRCNAVAPGPFPTEGAWSRLFPVDLVPKEIADLISAEERVPLKRVGEHDELANLIAYLASDFSGYVNGECVTIDGGEWLQGAGQFNWARKITPELWGQIEQWIRGKSRPSA